MDRVTVSPAENSDTALCRALLPETSVPLTAVMMSPTWRPPLSAPEPSRMASTSAPAGTPYCWAAWGTSSSRMPMLGLPVT